MAAKEILERLIYAKRTNVNALEIEAGIGAKTISKAIKRDGSLTVVTANKIVALYPDISLNWLLTGVEPMFTNGNTSKSDGNYDKDLIALYRQQTELQQQYAMIEKRTHHLEMTLHGVIKWAVAEVSAQSGKPFQEVQKRLSVALSGEQADIKPELLDDKILKQDTKHKS